MEGVSGGGAERGHHSPHVDARPRDSGEGRSHVGLRGTAMLLTKLQFHSKLSYLTNPDDASDQPGRCALSDKLTLQKAHWDVNQTRSSLNLSLKFNHVSAKIKKLSSNRKALISNHKMSDSKQATMLRCYDATKTLSGATLR